MNKKELLEKMEQCINLLQSILLDIAERCVTCTKRNFSYYCNVFCSDCCIFKRIEPDIRTAVSKIENARETVKNNYFEVKVKQHA
ncbi:MAG: hypothetical protein Q6363_008205 [Candidatus Njordarchaeota archaeon]